MYRNDALLRGFDIEMVSNCTVASGLLSEFGRAQVYLLFLIFWPETGWEASLQTLLTIAGFDPSSGAGVSADLAVFAAHGMFGTACVTALTVQSTLGVRAVEPVGGSVVRETLDCLWEDLPAGGDQDRDAGDGGGGPGGWRGS